MDWVNELSEALLKDGYVKEDEKKERLPSQEVLLKLLRYDQESGELWWRVREGNDRETNRWNTRYAGTLALAHNNKEYLTGCVCGVDTKSHRVIWKMMTGNEPVGVDHINGNKTDNRWCNLREADQNINNKNTKKRKDNKSGKTGVCWHSATNKWQATLKYNKVTHYLGIFEILEDAIKAREEAEQIYKFHENHGK